MGIILPDESHPYKIDLDELTKPDSLRKAFELKINKHKFRMNTEQLINFYNFLGLRVAAVELSIKKRKKNA